MNIARLKTSAAITTATATVLAIQPTVSVLAKIASLVIIVMLETCAVVSNVEVTVSAIKPMVCATAVQAGPVLNAKTKIFAGTCTAAFTEDAKKANAFVTTAIPANSVTN